MTPKERIAAKQALHAQRMAKYDTPSVFSSGRTFPHDVPTLAECVMRERPATVKTATKPRKKRVTLADLDRIAADYEEAVRIGKLKVLARELLADPKPVVMRDSLGTYQE